MGSEAEGWSSMATYRARYEVEEGGEILECTGQSCRSCSGIAVADCVAVCCCPCAVVSLLMLAFVKVPWFVGRRCWGVLKSKMGKKGRIRKVRGVVEGKDDDALERHGRDLREEEWGENSGDLRELASVLRRRKEMGNGLFDSCCQTEKVLMELYEVGHLGFGRVSFTGIQG